MIDRVPRTPTERARLLRARQEGWEAMLFAAVLLRERERVDTWHDEVAPTLTRPGKVLTDPEAGRLLQQALKEARTSVDWATKHLTPQRQERAFGKAEESGDAKKINELGARLMSGYRQLVWRSWQLRNTQVSRFYRPIYDAASLLIDLPLQQYRDFVARTVEEGDRLTSALRAGRPVHMKPALTLCVDDEAFAQFNATLDAALRRSRRRR